MMKLSYDRKADALYFRLDESPVQASEEVSPGVVLDFNADKQVIAIEILGLSKRGPNFDPSNFNLETT